jgi:4-diphosphocytidyl-2-C-methyl-D-erythritol kinase
MPTLTLPAHAKINLWLRILGRRADGYHEVATRMRRVSLADKVSVSLTPGKSGAELTCSDPSIPVDENNLALRALRAFQQETGREHGAWSIHLEKKIPAGAGLGGGSSNAATVLHAANELTGDPLSRDDIIRLAAGIGSDVAFFAHRIETGDASGRGEVITPAAEPAQLNFVLIKPPFSVSTPWAYQNWADSREIPGVLHAPQITPWGALVNDLERPVFAKWLFLASLKGWLLSQPECAAALMSGSGSTVFAITESGSDAAELAGRATHYTGEASLVEVCH